MANKSRQKEWKSKTIQYVESINAYVGRYLADGEENAGECPAEPGRDHLAHDVISAIREANANGQLESLRELWPPAHDPLFDLLEENGQSIPIVYVLPDNSIIARLDDETDKTIHMDTGKTIHIVGDSVREIEDVFFFGRCPNRRYFAIAQSQGIKISDGWNGPQVGYCPWPTGLENVPKAFSVKPFDGPPVPTQLIPFPDGTRVLLVSERGIFVLSSDKATRLLPTTSDMKEHFEWLQDKYPDDDLASRVSGVHGAISRDGKIIAVGDSDSTHLFFDENLKVIGSVGNRSEYPHYALFNSDDTMVAVNSCHLRNGITLSVPTNLLPELKAESTKDDKRISVFDDYSRVYAGASRQDEFIIGDYLGYVRAFGMDGQPRWQLFIGSSVGSIDVSDDGKTMVVSTYAGFLSIITMDAGKQAPHQIGNSTNLETRRWIFWPNEEKPLIW